MTFVHAAEEGGLEMAVESKTAPTAKEKVGAHLAGVRAQKYGELAIRTRTNKKRKTKTYCYC